MLSRNVLLYGREASLPPATALRSGPLELIFRDGDLRYIRCAGREILRRIYVAVRNHNWGTVPASLSQLEIASQSDHFRITYLADHGKEPVLFRWRAVIEGTAEGAISFSMDGKALATFNRNRIGICLHHPLRGFAGRECEIETSGGARRRDIVPEDVAPHQPFADMQAMSFEAAPGCRAELRFEGEIFEMEDQRNWTDASFKTYGTPLHLPFPVEIAAGTVVRQRVTLRLIGHPPARSSGQPSKTVTITLGGDPKPLPRIGVAASSTPWTPSKEQITRLRDLRLSHLRVDAAALSAPPPELAALGLPVELAVLLREGSATELERIAARVRELKLDVARWIICEEGVAVTTPAVASLARKILPEGRVIAGTRANFAELNRNRPAPGTFDGLWFTANPQVHAADNLSIAENCASYRDVLQTARRIASGLPVFVSPITLKMQFNAVATGAPVRPAPGALPADVDPRQMSLFCGGWTAAALKYMAEGGAAGVTFYETAGWKGIMESAAGSPAPGQFKSVPRCVFPVWHVLACAGEFRGGSVLQTESGDPLTVECLAISSGNRLRLISVNLSSQPQAVEIRGLDSWSSPRIKTLNASVAEQAMIRPEAFRASPWTALPAVNGRLRFELDSCAIATIDCGPSEAE